MKFSQPQGKVPGVLFSAFLVRLIPVLMWLNAFFASPLMFSKKILGEVQMPSGQLKVNHEARIFVFLGILVLIAIICAVVFAR